MATATNTRKVFSCAANPHATQGVKMNCYDILRIDFADKVAALTGCPKLQLRRAFLNNLTLQQCEAIWGQAAHHHVTLAKLRG